jgi:hypothetical protein
MRALLLIVAAVIAFTTTAVAQNNPPARPVYPMPPPPPVIITAPDGREVPGRIDTFSDKHTRCMQYGASIGVPADQIEDYTKRCALQ